eukprot:PhM_4_TR6184/c1_g1_i1/m.100253
MRRTKTAAIATAPRRPQRPVNMPQQIVICNGVALPRIYNNTRSEVRRLPKQTYTAQPLPRLKKVKSNEEEEDDICVGTPTSGHDQLRRDAAQRPQTTRALLLLSTEISPHRLLPLDVMLRVLDSLYVEPQKPEKEKKAEERIKYHYHTCRGWYDHGGEPCPACNKYGYETLSELHVMFGSMIGKRCNHCHAQWMCQAADDPDSD